MSLRDVPEKSAVRAEGKLGLLDEADKRRHAASTECRMVPSQSLLEFSISQTLGDARTQIAATHHFVPSC
jgi:hypothetical protein